MPHLAVVSWRSRWSAMCRSIAKFCALLPTRTRLSLVQGDIQHPMHAVLNPPMPPHRFCKALGVASQARTGVARFSTHTLTDVSFGLDHADTTQPGPALLRVQVLQILRFRDCPMSP